MSITSIISNIRLKYKTTLEFFKSRSKQKHNKITANINSVLSKFNDEINYKDGHLIGAFILYHVSDRKIYIGVSSNIYRQAKATRCRIMDKLNLEDEFEIFNLLTPTLKDANKIKQEILDTFKDTNYILNTVLIAGSGRHINHTTETKALQSKVCTVKKPVVVGGVEYESVKAAAIAHKCSPTNISKKAKSKDWPGYHFVYKE